MTRTLNYYAQNAESFAAETAAIVFSATRERFLAHLTPGAAILDYGCGSGRDTKAFLERGFQVMAVDGSPEMCTLALAYTGIPVRQMLFAELNDVEAYNGIWACASILHVPSAQLPDIFRRMITVLKPGGAIYVSFKYGAFEGLRYGRHYNDFTEESFAEFLRQFPELSLVDQRISNDTRPGREAEQLLNTILEKRG